MENERSYFFRDLIVKILLVLLFVFLLMWLFPMPNLNPFYDRIFTQNINSMTDAAKSYFTVARLPQNEGESKKLTLNDMLTNKMLVEFTDSEGKTCDKNKSYVEVTRKGNEYVFKTNLSCSTGEDYVIEYFGCYDVCTNGKCTTVIENNSNNENKEQEISKNESYYDPSENSGSVKGGSTTKKVTEYQFYRTDKVQYVESYTCKDGYTLKGNKCVKESNITKIENASLKCANGYSYNSITKKCEMLVSNEVDATLTCPKGFIYASTTGECLKSGDTTIIDANLSYSCKTGTLVGTKCVITDATVTDAEKYYTCPKGTLDSTTEKCIIRYEDEDAEKVYTCEKGVVDGDKCVEVTPNNKDAEKYYTCDEGTLEGDRCVVSTTTVDADKEYYCASGTRSGNSCIVSVPQTCSSYPVCSNRSYSVSVPTSSTGSSTGRYVYSSGSSRVYQECHYVSSCSGGGTTTTGLSVKYTCSNGTRDGDKCIIKNTVPAKENYRCDVGHLVDKKCIDNNIKTTDAKLTYKCEHGKLEGSVTNEVDAKKVYTCDIGQLEGTKCNISDIWSTKPVYTCKYGTLTSSNAKTCTITTIDVDNPIYYCPNGSTLAGTKCYISKNTSDIINAIANYKTKTETIYKWSTSEKLTGWTRTGKTRIKEIEITSKY